MNHPEIAAKYCPADIEDRWYQHWMQHGYFHSEPDHRDPYCIVIPPPNVTGILHMGHMLNNTIQDVLIRRARLEGKNACWVPGTDHASIATEAKVVDKLRKDGIDKRDLSREAFLDHAWSWKEKYGGVILHQLKKLGASCDWERTKFTMDPDLYESVIQVFVDLYNKGLIYRGVRMVNWDPQALTALSDEEVIYKEVQSKLYYLKYAICDSDQFLTVATTRPETILGDTAVCCHPDDPRYTHLKGCKVRIPIVNREIPIIFDAYVDPEFGTGCLKITPAHDINDYQIGDRHGLESIDIFNPNGTLNENGGPYANQDRFAVRKQIALDLDAAGLMQKIEDYTNKVGYSERTDAAIEPKLSMQWFLKMEDLAKPALEVVMSDQIVFHPAKFKNTYRHWMENVKDWCISRQLWWGQRIPAYYLPNRDIVVANTPEAALQKAQERYPDLKLTQADLQQDEDVLDTWFSSWLWPISVFDGIRHPNNPELNYYYPTNTLITAPEIIFFWVARMVMAGLEYKNTIPFKHVYFTGIVRDKQGRKMSKSLGNSPDPIELIQTYGADGVRIGMLLTSPAGNDIPFDESTCEQGRNFCNKIWNAMRLVKGWQVETQTPDAASTAAMAWFETKLHHELTTINDHLEKFRLSDALMCAYKLVWDDFCAWYLEMIKPPFGEAISEKVLEQTLDFFDQLLLVLHPFMPFITEELWHILRERSSDLMITTQQVCKYEHSDLVDRFAYAQEIVSALRTLRKKFNLPNKEQLRLIVKKNKQAPDLFFDPIITKLCSISELCYSEQSIEDAQRFIVGSTEFFVPLEMQIDLAAEIKKLQSELTYAQNFLDSVRKKLSNERFVQNAPASVLDLEHKKESDALQKITVIESQLAQINHNS